MTARRNLEWSAGAAGPLLRLVDPVVDWRSLAVCRPSDDRLFFPPKGAGAQRAVRRAKAICRECPVRAECLEFAQTHPAETEFGIFGGMTPNERLELVVSLIPPAARGRVAKPPETGRKFCGHCRTPKPLSDFFRRSDAPDGRQAWCKECQRPWRKRSTAA